MSRARALTIVTLLWAAIYLPSLGLFEIRGEEGRRILPGIAMLETGNYLVPQVGGEDYFRKPPLINWLIAGSFRLFGAQNEWTARAPSVPCVLLAAIAFITVGRRALGPGGSFIAAVVWLTNVGIVQKGRLIEIEALYVSLVAIALIFWLSWWTEERSPWLTWIVPWIFLGFALLAKGPTHLLFFYAVILAVLWKTKQWRALFHPAHLLGILIMLGIFGAWGIPFLHATQSGKAVTKWSSQFTGRFTGEIFTFSVWITCIPRAVAYFLPWLLLAPLFRFGKFADPREAQMARAMVWAAAVPLVLVSLIPGSAPRYSLPAMVPFCWLLGLVFSRAAVAVPAWLQKTPTAGATAITEEAKADTGIWPGGPVFRKLGTLFIVLAVLAGVAGYPIWALASHSREKVKNIADQINAVVPPRETFYAVDPNYQPFFFYMHAPVRYVGSLTELPYETNYFVTRPVLETEAGQSEQWAPRHAHSILKVKDYRHQTMVVFRVE